MQKKRQRKILRDPKIYLSYLIFESMGILVEALVILNFEVEVIVEEPIVEEPMVEDYCLNFELNLAANNQAYWLFEVVIYDKYIVGFGRLTLESNMDIGDEFY